MKKKLFLTLSFFSLILFGVISLAKLTPNTMSYDAAVKRWGHEQFSADSFKNGNSLTKAKMATDLLKQNPYKNKKITAVWSDLGKHDGYYKNDIIPAYIIDDKKDDTWQLVFLVDSERNVTDVVIHKNCCEK